MEDVDQNVLNDVDKLIALIERSDNLADLNVIEDYIMDTIMNRV